MDVEIVDWICISGEICEKQQNEWSHGLCLRCLQENDIYIHVLQYPAEAARTDWEKIIEDLEDTLVNLRTHPNIITVCKSRLLSWNNLEPFLFHPFCLREKVYKYYRNKTQSIGNVRHNRLQGRTSLQMINREIQ